MYRIYQKNAPIFKNQDTFYHLTISQLYFLLLLPGSLHKPCQPQLTPTPSLWNIFLIMWNIFYQSSQSLEYFLKSSIFLSYPLTGLFEYLYMQWRPSSQCHRAMALVVFLPRPESQCIFWASRNKKPQNPELALVNFSPDGRPCILFMKAIRTILVMNVVIYLVYHKP